ncbi:MAG TPA: tRNA pseudouridine(38-40) synthase TruA [Methylophilaceae bacterium]|nr:tRNA pseudouridine(38-40) synthase TruA [Methylophilaceae bacterium]HAJ71963.1 tRNA pseudouridine(38-40) synthase TruA [Methylophilaceae bacterium]
MRVALGVEYNGSSFFGWQSQSSKRGVQDALETALQSIANHPVRVHAAGRTDTGVHALMQVIHFDTSAERPDSAWIRGVNAHLPSTVRVKWAQVVDDAFHARFSAVQRHYQYVLVNQPCAPAIQDGRVGWYHLPLNLKAMQDAVKFLRGEHDFSVFRASECQAKSPIKTISNAEVRQQGACFIFDFSANAFLHHQVRNMIGALIYIGNGKHPASYMQALLAQKDRTQSPPTFSPYGLYLSGVQYDSQWGLPNTHERLTLI